MAYSKGRSEGRNWRNVSDDEIDANYDAPDSDDAAEDEQAQPRYSPGRSIAPARSDDVRDGEFRVLREDTSYPPRPASRSAAAPQRQRPAPRPAYDEDYDDGSDINSAYGVRPSRGGSPSLRANRPLITVPRSIPWVSIGCFGLLTAAAIVLLVITASVGGGISGIGSFFGGLFGGGKTTVTVDHSSTAVVQQMQALNKLETAKYTIEKVETAYQNSDFLNSLYGGKVLFVAHADVVAGVDMSKMADSDITVTISVSNTRQAQVHLPQAEIFSTTLDETKSYVYSADSNSIFGHLNPQIFDYVRSAAQQDIAQAAQEQGILTDANKNARDAIELMLRRLGFTDVTFKLASPLPARVRA
jgi:hypothetical protein